MAENNNTFLDKPRLDNLTNEIWKSAERLRGKFKQYEYQKVVLPMIVLRRLECVLVDWREQKKADIRAKRPAITDVKLAELVKSLEMNDRSLAFYNSTDWTLKKVYEDDSASLEKNFRAYIKGFSDKVQQIIDKFDYRNTIGLMAKYHRLAPIIGQYMNLALGPDALSPLEMGYVYEELLRRFSEQSGEEAGEHLRESSGSWETGKTRPRREKGGILRRVRGCFERYAGRSGGLRVDRGDSGMARAN